MGWALKLNLHDSGVESWFESWVWLHMTCSTLASGAAELSYRSWCLLIWLWKCLCLCVCLCVACTGGFSDPHISPEPTCKAWASIRPQLQTWRSFFKAPPATAPPEAGHRCRFRVNSNSPTPPVVFSPTPVVRGGCAGRFRGVGGCVSPRRPCAAGPVQKPGVDRCPSASSGFPATPPVWRKQV